jgi:CheY-like chemotaxis protein
VEFLLFKESLMVQPRSTAGHERARPSVLVIDDVEATRTGLAELLRMLGYDARGARNGAEGLQILRKVPGICAVVLDLLMPGTNGYWFREQQLRDPAIASIPVIVFTGVGQQDEISARLKVSDVLFKPLAVDRLLAAIGRYCAP